MTETVNELSFGEQLIGTSFNPSKDSEVDRAKQLCAELADIIYNEKESKRTPASYGTSYIENLLFDHTVGEILNAQMNVVKLLTLKY